MSATGWWIVCVIAVIAVIALVAVVALPQLRRGVVDSAAELPAPGGPASGRSASGQSAAGTSTASPFVVAKRAPVPVEPVPTRPVPAAEPASDQTAASTVPQRAARVDRIPADETHDPASAVLPVPPVDPALAALAALDVAIPGTGVVTPGNGAADVVGAVATRPGPHPGSALPIANGSAPSSKYPVKANAGSKKYYTADSPYFHRTRADLWFSSTGDAEAAGFVSWYATRPVS